MSEPRGGGHPVEAISALADGEIGHLERATVEEHLASCASCRALLDDIRALGRSVPEASVPDLPAGLAARVKSHLAGAGAAPRRGRLVLPVAVAATLAAVALLATVHFRSGLPERRPEPVGGVPTPRPEGAVTPALRDRAAPAPDEPVAPTPPPGRVPRDNKAAGPPAFAVPRDEPARKRSETRVAPDESVSAEEQEPAAARDQDVAKEGTAQGRAGIAPSAAAPAPTAKAERSLLRADEPRDCSSPWRVPGDLAWTSPRPPGAGQALAAVARTARGEAVAGRDDRGDFVTVRVPAAVWPDVLERLKALGVTVPTVSPSPPQDAECVVVDVRLEEAAPR